MIIGPLKSSWRPFSLSQRFDHFRKNFRIPVLLTYNADKRLSCIDTHPGLRWPEVFQPYSNRFSTRTNKQTNFPGSEPFDIERLDSLNIKTSNHQCVNSSFLYYVNGGLKDHAFN